jgi:hypothetical protein
LAGPGGPVACVACHAAADARFASPPARLGPAEHVRTGFSLERPHAGLACADCHRPGTAWAARFPGRRASDCRACHGDPHRGQFDRASARACTDCHAPDAFVPSAFDAAAHARTRFALTGAHEAVACDRCHAPDPAAGGAKRFVPATTDCAGCHADPHQGLFDGPDRPPQVAGRSGCARCHDTSRFDAITLPAEEHARWTGFALRGAHARAACADCHRPDAASPRRLGRAPSRCDECHADPHAGQFRGARGTDCARCHSEQGFVPSRFDHQRDARFALDATHRRLDCSACHRRDAGGTVRWRPLGTTCADCHDSRRSGR